MKTHDWMISPLTFLPFDSSSILRKLLETAGPGPFKTAPQGLLSETLDEGRGTTVE
jgi:hypothetical protein